jgi:hypothetical protein
VEKVPSNASKQACVDLVENNDEIESIELFESQPTIVLKNTDMALVAMSTCKKLVMFDIADRRLKAVVRELAMKGPRRVRIWRSKSGEEMKMVFRKRKLKPVGTKIALLIAIT